MTPLRGILRRLKGEPSSQAASPEEPDAVAASRSRRNAASPATGGGPIVTDEPAPKRRRGRRGGRGRRKDGAAEADTHARSDAKADAQADSKSGRQSSDDPDERRSRRGEGRSSGRGRGRSRGGRGEGRTNDGDRSNGSTSNGEAGTATGKTRPTRDEYRWGRRVDHDEADERVRQANRRRRNPRRQDLDDPLPEDVAFRPGEAGGDSSILPARRRKPIGFHDTARTLVGGARSIGTWVKRDVRHGNEDLHPEEIEAAELDPGAEAAERNVERAARELAERRAAEARGRVAAREAAGAASDDEDGSGETPGDEDDETDDRPRRRRGRRGGRGRRRPSPEADGIAAVEVDPDEAAEDSSDDEDDDVVASSPAAHSDHGNDEDPEDDEEDDRDEEDEEAPRRRRARSAADLAPVSDDQIPAAFAALGIQRRSLEQLARFGFTEPTPIQAEAIPALTKGLDVVGIAQTGSGKTIAFGVPMVEKLDPELPEVQGLVMVPTRELAQQVLDVLADLARPWGLEAVGILGGRSLKADFRALDGRPHIVVGTPGRVLDHLRRQTLSLRHVRYAVLDEADQMLDIGFLPDIRRILSRTPQRRQTALFSATMPGSIRRLIWQFMTDPETVRVDPEATPVETIEQLYFEVAQRDKVRAMRELIERELKGRSLIFCNMKRSVDHLARELEREGVRARALHGDLDQRQRDRVVQEFREGSIDALIATNVAARGLDIPEITHVVNFDVPQNLEEYVHRIGRTGRAGRDGKAITLVCEWDLDTFDQIQQGLTVEIRREELDLYRPASARSADGGSPTARDDDEHATETSGESPGESSDESPSEVVPSEAARTE